MALCLHDIIQLLTLSLMLLRTGLFLQSIMDIQNLPEHPPTLYHPSAASGDEPCKIRPGKAGTRKLEGD